MKFFKKDIFIPWFVLMTATLVFASNDKLLHESEQPSNDLVKREKKEVSCQGPPGLPGRDGRDGRDAFLRGPQGERGKAGPPGPPGQSSSTGGVVYTRWGRHHCPGTSKTIEIYSGIMGGSHYTNPGGGANYLCMPSNPIYDKYVEGLQLSTFVHGAEYEMIGDQYKIFPNPNLQDDNAPCAVCHAKSRGSHMMIPARNVCPSGWTMEYKGYLMTERYNHARTQYICVDGEPEAIHGSHRSHNGVLLYFVDSHCGHGLPCPPYVNGRELTCVVCTQ